MMVTKCSKSFAGFYKSWLALKVMHDYVVRTKELCGFDHPQRQPRAVTTDSRKVSTAV